MNEIIDRACDIECVTEADAKAVAALADLAVQLQSRLESLEKDAARWREYKENSHIRFSLFSGRYRADNGFSILTDWIESFDECFDTAMQANKGE